MNRELRSLCTITALCTLLRLTPSIATAEHLEIAELADFRLATLDLPTTARGTFSVEVPIDGQSHKLHLCKRSFRAAGFRLLVQGPDGTLHEEDPPPVCTYRGVDPSIPGSRVVASFIDGRIRATIHAGHGPVWNIQPLSDYLPDQDAPDRYVISHVDDHISVEQWQCGTGDLSTPDPIEPPQGQEFDALLDQLDPADQAEVRHALDTGRLPHEPDDEPMSAKSGTVTFRVSEIAFDSDYEFFLLNGSSVAATELDIESVMNEVANIYENELRITYEITAIIVRTAEPDPYSVTGPDALLGQFTNRWNHNEGYGISRDIAHLMTGKNLDGNVIGVAWKDYMCDHPHCRSCYWFFSCCPHGYGLSQSRFSTSPVGRAALTAHELGHNWSADHCNGDPDCAVMCSSLGGCVGNVKHFGGRSSASISNRSRRSCLHDLSVTTPTITSSTTLPTGTVDTPYAPHQLAVTGSAPPYSWETKPATIQNLSPTTLTEGNYLNWRADEQVWQIDLPFGFPYGGDTFVQAWVSSNGFIQFSSTRPPPSPLNSSFSLWLYRRIAPLWDDLSTGGIVNRPEDIYYTQPTPDSFTIRWQGHTHASNLPVDFACTLFVDGRVRFDYGESNEGLTPTVGLGLGNLRQQLVTSHNGAQSLSNADSVLFTPNSLPDGITLSGDGLLSGTPTQGGLFHVQVRVEDDFQLPDRRTFTLQVDDPATQPPRIQSMSPWPGSRMWSNKQPSPVEFEILFSEHVNITAADVSVVDDGDQPVPFEFSYVPGELTARIFFNETLPEGVYTFTIPDSVTDLDGMALDGEIVADQLPSGDLVEGGDAVWTFEVMPWWAEFQVNTYTAGDQITPGITMASDGSFVVVWESAGQDGSGAGVYLQRYDSTGAKLDGETLVNTQIAGDQEWPDIAGNSNGNFGITWESPNGTSRNLYTRLFGPDGVPNGPETHFATSYRGSAPPAKVVTNLAMNEDGTYLVTWDYYVTAQGGGDIYARRFDAQGNATGSLIDVTSSDPGGPDSRPVVQTASDASFVVAWQGWHTGGNGRDIWARRYDADATPLGTAFLVNSIDSGSQAGARVGVGPDDSWILAWDDDAGADGSAAGHFARRYDADGDPLAGQFLVNDTYTSGIQGNSGRQPIPFDDQGNHVIAWYSDGQDGSSYGVFAKRFGTDGQQLGGVFRVNTHTADSQRAAATAMRPSGDFVIAWQSAAQDGDDDGIFAQYFDVTPPVIVSATPAPNTVYPSTSTNTIEIEFSEDVVIDETQVHVIDDFGITQDDFTFNYEAATREATLTYPINLPAGRSYTVSVDDTVYRRDLRPGITVGIDDFQVFLDGDWPDPTIPSGDGVEGGDAVWNFVIGRDVPWAGEARLNFTQAGAQYDAAAAGLRDDLFAAAWTADNADSDGLGIQAGRFDRFAQRVGPQFLVNQTETGDQADPVMAAFEDETYLVVWSGNGAGDDSGIFARRFTADGTPLSEEVLVNQTTDGIQRNPAIDVNDKGLIVIAWESNGHGAKGDRDPDFGVFARVLSEDLYAPSGTDELQVNFFTSGDQVNPDVAWIAGGGYVVVWESPDGDGSGVLAQVFDPAGWKVGGEFATHSAALNDQRNPAVAALPAAEFLVVWQDSAYDGDGFGIVGQAFDIQGQGSGEFQINETAGGDQSQPAIERLTESDLVVAWEGPHATLPPAENYTEIYHRRIDWAAEAPLGPEEQMNTATLGIQQRPAISALDQGDFLIVWNGDGPFSDTEGIYGRWFDATPPTVTGLRFASAVDKQGRSRAHEMIIEFSEPVAVTPALLSVIADAAGSQPFAASYDDHAWVLTLTFGSPLPEEVNTLNIPSAAAVSVTGTPLDGGDDGLAGDDYSESLDLADPDCLIDGDEDGVVDCEDVCPGEADGLDFDADGTPDGCDACPEDPTRTVPEEPGVEFTCADGLDNDCDGLPDAADPDCLFAGMPRCGDFNDDGGVTLDDYIIFSACLGQGSAAGPACSAADMNGSGFIDLVDFAIFQELYQTTSFNEPPNCP